MKSWNADDLVFSVWAGGFLLLTGLCCWVPYLMDSLKNIEHRCGGCGVMLATVHKSGTVDVHQYH
jgi:lipopolysaccharide-induced tumor necrosis factor-alpha factor